MAVTFHGFSIRDYTSKMRSVDVFKCWPFPAAGVSREGAESWLPPMSVPKSRRWSDEVLGLRSNLAGDGGTEERLNERNESDSEKEEVLLTGGCAVDSAAEEEEKVELVCPVCGDFNAATLTAVNAHIDSCLARTVREERRRMRRSKSKAPKRRSISEIFELKEDAEEEKPLPENGTGLKLLPFDAGEVSITVTKFRWLSERLEALRSNGISFESVKSVEENSNSAQEEEKSEMLCPVCRVFNTATVTAANAHIDSCLASATRDELWQKPSLNNTKPKAPKKRSLADILTVTPQINASSAGEPAPEAEKDAEGEEDGEEFEKYVFSGARIKSKKCTNNNVTKKKNVKKVITRKKNKVEKRNVVTLNNESKKINKTRKKKKKKLNNDFTATKGDVYKRKIQNPVYSFRKIGTVGNKKVKLDGIDASSAYEKKLGLKKLSEEPKEKVKNRHSVGKQQKAVSPIRGILKNHKDSSESTSSGSNIQDGTEESHVDVQVPSSEKHVRFSAEDSIVGPEKRNSFDETVFSLSSDVLASSFGKEHEFTGNDEGTVDLVENRNDNTAINTDKRKEVSTMVESKQFSNTLGHVHVHNLLKPCSSEEQSKHLEEKSESLSNVTICDNSLDRVDRGNTTTTHVFVDVSRSLSEFQRGQTSGINTQACESEAFTYTGKFIDHLGCSMFQSTNANTRTYLEPSPSYSASCNKVNKRHEFPLHTYGNNDNNVQAFGGRSLSGTFSADMIDNSFLLPGLGKRSKRNSCIEQNYYGLPLNSHGELINFSSSGKVGMNKTEISSTLRGSLSDLPVNNVFHQNSQEHLSIVNSHIVQKTLQDRIDPFPHYPGRLGVRELDGRERGDIYLHNSDWCSKHYFQPLDSELNLVRNPVIEPNQLDKVSNHKEYGMVSPRRSSGLDSTSSSQPTMRLMGKDVPIGRSSMEKQQCVGGVPWVDEESRRRHYSVDAAKDNSLLERCYMPHRASGSQLQTETENVLQFQSMKIQSNQPLQSTLLMKGPNSEFLDLQSNHHISQNGSLGVSRNASANWHTISQAPTSRAIYNRPPEDFPEQFISGAKPQGFCFHSQVSSSPCNFNQSTLSNGELNDRKKHHHSVTNSSFGFPFLHPIVEEQAKSSWFNRSYRNLPPGSLGITHERPPGSSSSTSFPHNTWRNDSTIPFMNHSADVLYPPDSVTSHCPRKIILCPTSIAHPHSPHASLPPIIKPPSAIDSGCRNIFKVTTDRVKFDDMNARHHHPCSNSRKRPSASFVDLSKPNKLPNIEVQKNFSHMTGLARETSSANLLRNIREVELDLQVGARSKCCENEAQNLNPSSYHHGFEIDSSKHILKPSQNQDNLTPIHSAIPIAVTTESGRDLELQRKLTKLYIF